MHKAATALPGGQSPLGTQKISRLIAKFAVPSIISMLVGALYNIVDQIFIGQGVGPLGNAATGVAFPLTTISTALALLIGIGTASNFNLAMGAGKRERAGGLVGNGVFFLVVFGVALAAVVLAFLQPLMLFFGATPTVLPYALSYTGITAFGLPFLVFSTGCSHLIRADGSPLYSMLCMLVGAICNTILDPIFIFSFNMGVAGAAIATVISQVVSCLLAAAYLLRFKTLRLTLKLLRPRAAVFAAIVSLGVAACFNQLAMTVVQIALNNTLTHYGAASAYGGDIPLAVASVISKVNMVYMSVVVGIAQGCQPIFGYNYGAKNYARVKQTYKLAAIAASAVAVLSFLAFQLFPLQIIYIFGRFQPVELAMQFAIDGQNFSFALPLVSRQAQLYYYFAQQYFRVFMGLAFINGIQPLTSNFFTSIGKATRGVFMSLTRQVIFLLPLILLLPRFLGLEGVLFAGPVADGAAGILAIALVYTEMKRMGKGSGAPLPHP